MLRNYLITTFRSFKRYKLHSVVTILGLGVGITCSLLILLYVQDELSYDRHFEDYDRIVRLVRESSSLSAGPMAPALAADLAGVQAAARIDYDDDVLLTDLEGRSFESRVFFADSSIFDIFSFQFVRGSAGSALASMQSIVLTESSAKKIFGDDDPMGQTVSLTADETVDLTVSAVLKDLPRNTHFRFQYLASFELISARSRRMENWSTNWLYTYAILSPGTDAQNIENQLPGFFERNTGEAWDHFQIQPLTDIHLKSGRSFDIEPQGNFALLWTFMAIALLIVVIASVNFANLATARAFQRAREIGMRKALGANRSQLMQQFLGEAIFQALIATVIGLGAAALLLPLMNDFAGKSFEVSELFAARYQLLVWSGAIIVGVAAGLYPAGVLANINSLTTLKGGGSLSAGKVSVRRSLVLFQFVASTFLLLVTIGVYRQVRFMQVQPLGFNKDLTMVVSLEGIDLNEMGEVIRERLGSHNGVMSVTLSGSLPGDEVSDFLYRPEGWLDPEDLPGFDTFFIDESFSETMEIELVSGRALSRDMMSDVNAFLINESAARLLAAGGDGSWVDPLGKQMEFMVPGSEGWYTLKTGEIVGVVSDFHYRSLHETIDPLVLHVFAPAFDKALVKVAAISLPETIDHLRSEVESVNAGRPFEYFFLDSFLDNLYQNERRIGRLLSSFAILVVVIACLGLFGLAAISVQHRRREIGIRKVLGAQWYGLVGLFIKEYAVLVFAASVLAIPLAVFASSKWLSTFAYQAPESAWVFLWVVLASLIVATVSVSYQALRAALSNPVDALRNES